MKAFLKDLNNMAKAVDGLPAKLAPFGLECIRDNYRNGHFTPNKPLTKSLKNGGAKPLFDTGETFASLTYQVGDDAYTLGTPKLHAAMLNDGGIIKPLKSQKLTIPADRTIKKRVDAYGVRKTLEGLERQGWKIFWRPNSVIGRAPVGAKGIGRRIKTSMNKNNKASDKGIAYVLFLRADKVTIPAREFMYLSEEQQREQAELAQQAILEVTR